jgi:hypothetical protein
MRIDGREGSHAIAGVLQARDQGSSKVRQVPAAVRGEHYQGAIGVAANSPIR